MIWAGGEEGMGFVSGEARLRKQGCGAGQVRGARVSGGERGKVRWSGR